jgi:hypothetical protein
VLFSPGNSSIGLLLQLWLVSSSPSKVGQFSFEYCPQSHQISSEICHAPNLGGLVVASPLLSAPFLALLPLTESLAPCPILVFHSSFSGLPQWVKYNSLFMFLRFVHGGVQFTQKLCWIMFWEGARGVDESCVVCSTPCWVCIYSGSFETGQQGEVACHFSLGTY